MIWCRFSFVGFCNVAQPCLRVRRSIQETSVDVTQTESFLLMKVLAKFPLNFEQSPDEVSAAAS